MDEAGRAALSKALDDKPFRETLRSLLAQLGSARTLRVVHWVGQSELPGRDQLLANLLDDKSPDGRALHAALAAMTRSALLSAIFDPARIVALEAVALGLGARYVRHAPRAAVWLVPLCLWLGFASLAGGITLAHSAG